MKIDTQLLKDGKKLVEIDRNQNIKEFGGVLIIMGATALVTSLANGNFTIIGAIMGLGFILHQVAVNKLWLLERE